MVRRLPGRVTDAPSKEGLDDEQKNEYMEAFALHDEKNHGRIDAKKLQEVRQARSFFSLQYLCHFSPASGLT